MCVLYVRLFIANCFNVFTCNRPTNKNGATHTKNKNKNWGKMSNPSSFTLLLQLLLFAVTLSYLLPTPLSWELVNKLK